MTTLKIVLVLCLVTFWTQDSFSGPEEKSLPSFFQSEGGTGNGRAARSRTSDGRGLGRADVYAGITDTKECLPGGISATTISHDFLVNNVFTMRGQSVKIEDTGTTCETGQCTANFDVTIPAYYSSCMNLEVVQRSVGKHIYIEIQNNYDFSQVPNKDKFFEALKEVSGVTEDGRNRCVQSIQDGCNTSECVTTSMGACPLNDLYIACLKAHPEHPCNVNDGAKECHIDREKVEYLETSTTTTSFDFIPYEGEKGAEVILLAPADPSIYAPPSNLRGRNGGGCHVQENFPGESFRLKMSIAGEAAECLEETNPELNRVKAVIDSINGLPELNLEFSKQYVKLNEAYFKALQAKARKIVNKLAQLGERIIGSGDEREVKRNSQLYLDEVDVWEDEIVRPVMAHIAKLQNMQLNLAEDEDSFENSDDIGKVIEDLKMLLGELSNSHNTKKVEDKMLEFGGSLDAYRVFENAEQSRLYAKGGRKASPGKVITELNKNRIKFEQRARLADIYYEARTGSAFYSSFYQNKAQRYQNTVSRYQQAFNQQQRQCMEACIQSITGVRNPARCNYCQRSYNDRYRNLLVAIRSNQNKAKEQQKIADNLSSIERKYKEDNAGDTPFDSDDASSWTNFGYLDQYMSRNTNPDPMIGMDTTLPQMSNMSATMNTSMFGPTGGTSLTQQFGGMPQGQQMGGGMNMNNGMYLQQPGSLQGQFR